MPAAIQAAPENAMPAPIRRSAVTSTPARRSSGYSTRLLNGISSITSTGFSACICAAENQSGLAMRSPCRTQVEAFWSNSDQNGVTSANTIRIRSTARAVDRLVRMHAAGAVELDRGADAAEGDQQPQRHQHHDHAVGGGRGRGLGAADHAGQGCSPTSASTAPRAAMNSPGRPPPGANTAVRTSRRNECGCEVVAGTCTYLLRPAQKITVATAISRPGMPKATLGPYSRRKIGISSEAKNEPKLMIQ